MLVDMRLENDMPVALGVLFDDPRPTFERAVVDQNETVSKGKTPNLQALLAKGQTWTVE
jgi:2-oxoglutarate ferredoxin oxidoreductase subunit beta